jgi:hypothetical protein
VEVKELQNVPSPVEALANGLGKYRLYKAVLRDTGNPTPLYLAITQVAYQGILKEPVGRIAFDESPASLLIFDHKLEEIVKWIP